jgi:hypothetical protein
MGATRMKTPSTLPRSELLHNVKKNLEHDGSKA